jgi:putative hydrolase of the HAD superfamily
VIFDLDDTLIREVDVAMERLAGTTALIGDHRLDPVLWRSVVLDEARRRWRTSPWAAQFRELGFASWEGLWSDGDGNHPRLDGLAEWLPGYRRDTWTAALQEVGASADRGADLADEFSRAQRSGHPLMPGAEAAVAVAGANRDLALLTNGPSDIQRHKLAQTPLEPAFSTVVVSGELGAGKPSAAAFAAALDGLGAAPERTVMVGDSWERDVMGSLEAGLAGAVWLAHGRQPPAAVPGAVMVVDELPESLSLLG